MRGLGWLGLTPSASILIMIFNCDFFCNMSRVYSCKLFLCQFRVKVPMGTGIGGGVDRKGGEE